MFRFMGLFECVTSDYKVDSLCVLFYCVLCIFERIPDCFYSRDDVSIR